MLDQLIGALYDTGFVPYEDDPIIEESTAFIRLCSSPSFGTYVTLIIEDEKIFLLKNLLYLPTDKNTTSALILQQQANLLLEQGYVGRVCLDSASSDGVEDDTFALMYSLVVPASVGVDAAAQLIVSACGALELLLDALEDIEPKMNGAVLPPTDAFLVDINQEDVEITLHPALQLMSIPREQRNAFMSFLQEKGITVDEFMNNSKKLDLFCVTTDSITLTLANGCGGCWELGEIPIRKMTHTELECIVLPMYTLYTAGCKLLGLTPRSLDSVLWDIQYYI